MFCITSSWTIDIKVNWTVDDIGITGQLIQWLLLVDNSHCWVRPGQIVHIIPPIILSFNSPKTSHYSQNLVPIILSTLLAVLAHQRMLNSGSTSTSEECPHWQNQNARLFCSNCNSTAVTHQEGTRVALICSVLLSDAVCTCTLNEYYTKFHTYSSQVFSDAYSGIIHPSLAWTSTVS